MQRIHVSSSIVLSVGYDAAFSTLEVELHTHEIFQYFNVPLSNYIELMNSPSKDQYYNQSVKPAYESKKVSMDIA